MTIEKAKEILAAAQADPKQTTYTQAQVLQAVKIVSGGWAKR